MPPAAAGAGGSSLVVSLLTAGANPLTLGGQLSAPTPNLHLVHRADDHLRGDRITLCDPMFDDVTDHQLWRNDDGSNAGFTASERITTVRQSSIVIPPLHRLAGGGGGSTRDGATTPTSSRPTSISPPRLTANSSAGSSRLSSASPRPTATNTHRPNASTRPTSRPASGEYLTRLYQVKKAVAENAALPVVTDDSLRRLDLQALLEHSAVSASSASATYPSCGGIAASTAPSLTLTTARQPTDLRTSNPPPLLDRHDDTAEASRPGSAASAVQSPYASRIRPASGGLPPRPSSSSSQQQQLLSPQQQQQQKRPSSGNVHPASQTLPARAGSAGLPPRAGRLLQVPAASAVASRTTEGRPMLEQSPSAAAPEMPLEVESTTPATPLRETPAAETTTGSPLASPDRPKGHRTPVAPSASFATPQRTPLPSARRGDQTPPLRGAADDKTDAPDGGVNMSLSTPQQQQQQPDEHDDDVLDAEGWAILASAFPHLLHADLHPSQQTNAFDDEMWAFEAEEIRQVAKRAANAALAAQYAVRQSSGGASGGGQRATKQQMLAAMAAASAVPGSATGSPKRKKFTDHDTELLRGKLSALLGGNGLGDLEVPLITFTDYEQDIPAGSESSSSADASVNGGGGGGFARRARRLSMHAAAAPFGPMVTMHGYDGDATNASDWMERASQGRSLQRRIADEAGNGRGGGGGGGAGAAACPEGSQRRFSMADFSSVFGLTHKSVVDERETNIPPQDLHLLQLYSLHTNTVNVYRPVSDVVPDLYIGDFFLPPQHCDGNDIPKMFNEIDPKMTDAAIKQMTRRECRIKGKGIGISLKSSPYPPITGLIPLNPNLSKTYSEARKKERALEDQLMRTRVGCISTSLLRKIRQQRSLLGASSTVAVLEINAYVEASQKRLDAALSSYHAASAYATDKLDVSIAFLATLNESQFVGRVGATWRMLPLYTRVSPSDPNDVERNESGDPKFYVLAKDGLFYNYIPHFNEIDADRPVFETARMSPVEVLTHRSFIISPVTHRIEPDPKGDFLIGPDFDGFAYAKRNRWDLSVEEYYARCEARIQTKLLPTFGQVCAEDLEFILDMRQLTEWKQSHGYECANTVKTQEVTDGNYVVITPDDLFISTNFQELMHVFGIMWQQGYPLLLNPNWRVMLHPTTFMPVLIGADEVTLPIIDDCGLAFLKYQLAEANRTLDEVKAEAHQYIEMCAAARRSGHRIRYVGPALVPQAALVLSKKLVAEKFYQARRWTLMPPMMLPLSPEDLARKTADSLETFMEKLSLRKEVSLSDARGGNVDSFADQQPHCLDDFSVDNSASLSFDRAQRRRVQEKLLHAKKDPMVHEFEVFRELRCAELCKAFDEECAVFEAVFGEAEAAKFTEKLKPYFDPATAVKNSVLTAAMTSMRESTMVRRPSAAALQRMESSRNMYAGPPQKLYLAPPKAQREQF